MTVAIVGSLRQQLSAIAAREGCTVPELVCEAARLLVESYPPPARRQAPPAIATIATTAAAPAASTPAAAVLPPAPATTIMTVPPRLLKACRRCDHSVAAHDLDIARCFGANGRCVCAEFVP